MKSKQEERFSQIRSLQIYQEGAEFTIGEMESRLHYTVDYETLRRDLLDMAERGQLKGRKVWDKGAVYVKYRKAGSIVSMPWRKHTNTELGVEAFESC